MSGVDGTSLQFPHPQFPTEFAAREQIVCGAGCPADIAPAGKPDGDVNIDDMFEVIAQWGSAGGSADLAGGKGGGPDGQVNIDDLFFIIAAWGPCQ